MACGREINILSMKNVYSVGEVNAYIKNMFAQDYMLRSIIVSGEVSNVKYHSSGHIYFTMKDKSGAISCIMFSSNARRLDFRLTEGTLIEATGSVTVYERDGKYQLYATDIKAAGAGLLYEKYEKLKAELEEMGMFDESYKQPIPRYVSRVGIVTAQTGAAVRDIMQIAKRRNPYVQLILYPALVQGVGAKESIVRGIKTLDSMGVDVIIVGRGGGSIEDLWAFNEECVARAIFEATTPIISAVGHETDTTIADYVADLRAPTPSAAAELAVYSIEDLYEKIDGYKLRLNKDMSVLLEGYKNGMRNYRLLLEKSSPQSKIKEKRVTFLNLTKELDMTMNDKVKSRRHRMEILAERMKAASPLERLSGGYAYVTGADGKQVKKIGAVKVGDDLKLRMRDGVVKAEVKEVESVAK